MCDNFSGLTDIINSTEATVSHLNNLFGINIANSPVNLISTGWNEKNFILIIGAVMVPLISYLTQVLNIKLMTNNSAAMDDNGAMAKQMKSMNTMMPLFSLVMVFSVPVGALFFLLLLCLLLILFNNCFQIKISEMTI